MPLFWDGQAKVSKYVQGDIKHLMTGHKGNSESLVSVFSPRLSMGTLRVELFFIPPFFVFSPFLKAFSCHYCKKIIYLTPAGTQICRGFKVHDLNTCESKVQVAVSLGS